MKNKKLLYGFGLLTLVGLAYFIFKPSKESSFCGNEEVSNFKTNKKDREGIKRCDCTYTGKAQSKSCSKSVSCKDCCEGGGLGDTI